MRARFAIVVLLSALAGAPARAQSGGLLAVSVGLGSSSTDSSAPGSGSGGYAHVGWAPWRDRWFTPKPYAGGLLTRPSASCGAGVEPCDVSASLFFLGGAVRLMAPLPYLAPFVESGIGASLGSMRTRSGSAVDVRWSGLTYHVPVAVGLALGSQHEYELAVQYLLHPAQHQINGAFAVGFAFPL
jgi:hypothetical protein